MNPWYYVLLGGVFETGWAITMKLSDGFTEVLWIIPTVILIIISTLLLNRGLTAKLPTGSAYSVWVGIGAVGSLISGMILFEDSMTPIKLAFVIMIIAGVIGIEHEHGKEFSKLVEEIETK